MSHANAALTPRARLRLAKLIVEEHWPVATAAKMFMVSPPTARKWATRFRAEGPAGMADRSSRPSTMPTRTPPAVVKQIVAARWRRRLGPAQIAGELRMPASTVHAVLVRCRINRLARLDRATGEPIRRYEHPHPGSLIHVDVTKFGRIPDGGGHRFVGRQQGMKHRAATSDREGTRDARYQPRLGVGFLHTVIDDHSRFAYVEMHSDERSQTAIAVLRRAVAHFARLGVEVERVLTDNGSAYRLSGSIARSLTGGPTPGSTAQRRSAGPRCLDGCTSTIIIASTPRSAPRLPPGSITSLDITSSHTLCARLVMIAKSYTVAWGMK